MIIVSSLLLWILFIVVVVLKPKAERKGGWIKVFFYLILIPAYIYDIVYNTIIGSILFLEVPHHIEPFTARLKRNLKRDGWRWSLANWFCQNLIEKIDPRHCGRMK